MFCWILIFLGLTVGPQHQHKRLFLLYEFSILPWHRLAQQLAKASDIYEVKIGAIYS